MVGCVAFGCKSRGERKDPGITFHRFPKNLEIHKKWIKNIQLNGWVPKINSRLCSKHFEKKCFYKTDQKVKLLAKAVPTLFLQLPRNFQKRKNNLETMVTCPICKCRLGILTKHKSFHRFPKDPKQRKKWLDFVNIDGWFPKRHHRVCSDHFDEKDFYFLGNRKRLSLHAVPKHLDVRTRSPIDAFVPSTSERIKQDLSDLDQMQPISDQSSKKELVDAETFQEAKRRRIKTKRIGAMKESLTCENGNQAFEEILIKEDQSEFLTIIDDNSTVSSVGEQEPVYKESLHFSPPQSPLLDKSTDILNDSDNESSSAMSDDQNSLLSNSELNEEMVKALKYKSRRAGRPRFFGDCSAKDMDNPVRARICWYIARRTINDLKIKVKLLQRRNYRLIRKVQCLRSLFQYLDENDFLNQYANAAIKAVVSDKVNPTSSS